MEFGVLGPLEATMDGVEVRIAAPKQRALLAVLVLHANQMVSSDRLLDLVWGDTDGGVGKLRFQISKLRDALEPDRNGNDSTVLVTESHGYRLVADPDNVDIVRFERLAAEAHDRTAADAGATLTLTDEALGLWRGPALGEFEYNEWAQPAIRHLNEVRLAVVEDRLDALLALGRARDVVAQAQALVTDHPLSERFRAQHMVALYRTGRHAEALRAYERTRTYLVEETGLDPSPELQRLEQQILSHDASLMLEGAPAAQHVAILVADVAEPQLLSSLGSSERQELLRRQSGTLDRAVGDHGGRVFAHRGSAMFAAFDTVERAVATAASVQQALNGDHQGMRMAIDAGDMRVPGNGHLEGPAIVRAVRLAARAHGGQVLVSDDAMKALSDTEETRWTVRALARHEMDGAGDEGSLHQLVVDGLPGGFPPLRSDAAPPPLPIDVRGLPGYELREEVGAGAFGVVHRAYQPSVGREVAIKTIRPEYANEPGFIRHFEVEAQLVARLEHPHVVPLHDYWRTPDGAYLVMRWMAGGTLAARVADHRLDTAQADALIDQIAPALAYAHKNGVIHRDINLSNILFDSDGEAYFSDFGIARFEPNAPAGSIVDDVHDLARVLAASLDTSAANDDIRNLLAGAASEASAYESIGTFVEAWKAAIGAGPGASHPDIYTPTRNPYKGLRAFGELDAQDFHGRDAEVRDIIDTLAERRLVAVIGPSGIGKSSVVRAGMVPALRDGAIGGSEVWLIADMLPGAYPYEELASALVRVAAAAPPSLEDVLRSSELGLTHGAERYLPDAQAVLLIIDQFEELFTLAPSEERRSFLAMLAATIHDEDSRVRIVVTMRADFFDRPLRFPDLGAALRDGTVPISAPSDAAVAEIVERPAAGVGVRFEPGLVDRVVSDVKDQPGALPLLEYALTELFSARETDTLTLEAYAATGGVLGALGRRAETIYQNLDAVEQDACRQIFLRLVRASEATRDTRRRIRLAELTRLGIPKRTLVSILNVFGDHRLFTFDRDPATRVPTVEVAHEAILTEWLRLADWIDERREDLLLHSRLAIAVADWETADRSDSYLLTGGRLRQHEAWTTDTDLTLTTAEREFLDASRTREDTERASRRRRRRLIMTGFGAAALIAVLLATAALIARNDAQDNERLAEAKTAEATANAALAEENEVRAEEKTVEAEANAAQAAEERTIALAGQLGAAALDEISSDPERAVLLGIESLNRATTPSGLNATHAALFRHYAAWVLGKGPLNFLMDVPFAIHPDGKRVLVVEGVPLDGHLSGVVALYDVVSPSDEPIWRAQIAGSSTIEDLPFVWFDENEVLISISDIGTSEATTNPSPSSVLRGIQILDMSTGDLVESIQFDGCVASIIPAVPHLGRKSPLIVIYGGTSESGECLSWGNPIGSVEYRPDDPITAKPVELAFPDPFRWVKYTPRASDDGTLVAFGNENAVFVFDAGTGEVVEEYDGNRITISGSGNRVIIDHRTEGYAELIDRESGDTLVTFPGEFLGNFSFSRDNTRFIAGSYDGATHVFDVETGLQIHELRGTHYNPVFLDLSDDPDTFLTGSYDSGRVINLGDRSEIQPPISDLGSRLESWGFTGHHAAVTIGGDRAYVPFVDDQGTGYRIYDLDDGSVIRKAAAVWRVAAMSPDGRYVVEVPGMEAPDGETREAYGAMQLVDAATGAVILVFGNTCGFDASPGGGPPYDPQESCEDGQLISPLSDIEFSADGSRIAIDSWANTTAVFSTSTGSPISSISSDRDDYFDLDGGVVGLSPDGNTLLYRSSYEPGQGSPLTMVDIDTNEVVGVAYQFNPNYEIEFSENGSRAYTANWAGIVYIYDVETFELVDTLTRGQGGGILDVAVRGNLVATATFDKVVRVQTLDTHELMLEVALDVKAENVEFLNDDHLLVVTLDGDPLVFTMDGDELAEVARQRLTRGFTAEECASFSLDPCPTLEEIRGG